MRWRTAALLLTALVFGTLFATSLLSQPEEVSDTMFSRPGGLYQETISVELTPPYENAQIFYTLDGTEPTTDSILYEQPITIAYRPDAEPVLAPIPTTHFSWAEPESVFMGTVIKARAFIDGKPVGEIQTNTYLVAPDIKERYKGLPIICLSMDPKALFDEETGIYVPGSMWQDSDNLWAAANYREKGMEWERPAYLEFYEADGSLAFGQHIGLRLHGGITRSLPQKSLRIYARQDYGESKISYQVFPDNPVDEFKRLVLRTSGDDWRYTLFRDGLSHVLFANTRVDVQSFRPAVVFINGEFWGIHNIRERQDKHYLATYYGVHPDYIDMLENNLQVQEGDDQDYRRFMRYVESHDLSQEEHYRYVESQMDIDNFIDHHIAHIYTGNRDSMTNNIRYWKEKGPAGKWRWLLYDLDYGFFYTTHDTLDWALDPNLRNRPWGTLLLRKLLENDEFRVKFINRYADLLNSNLHPEHVQQEIDRLSSQIAHVVPEHLERWGHPFTMDLWQQNVESMKKFAAQRPGYVREHICKQFGLESTVNVVVEVEGQGTVTLNSLQLASETSWEGIYFKGVPLSFTATPAEGYTFVGWRLDTTEAGSEESLTLTPDADVKVIAVFAAQ